MCLRFAFFLITRVTTWLRTAALPGATNAICVSRKPLPVVRGLLANAPARQHGQDALWTSLHRAETTHATD